VRGCQYENAGRGAAVPDTSLCGKVIAGGALALLVAWWRLGMSDHAYYRCTKGLGDRDVHRHFGQWDDPCDALVACMHVLEGLKSRLARQPAAHRPRGEDWAGLAGANCVAFPGRGNPMAAGDVPLSTTPETLVALDQLKEG
jgi:hypothetical protein